MCFGYLDIGSLELIWNLVIGILQLASPKPFPIFINLHIHASNSGLLLHSKKREEDDIADRG